jgi:hypothetical protein
VTITTRRIAAPLPAETARRRCRRSPVVGSRPAGGGSPRRDLGDHLLADDLDTSKW